MQASVPGILTKPAPYALHNFTDSLWRCLAASGGREGVGCAFGLTSVCAPAPPLSRTASVAAAIVAARRIIKRHIMAAGNGDYSLALTQINVPPTRPRFHFPLAFDQSRFGARPKMEIDRGCRSHWTYRRRYPHSNRHCGARPEHEQSDAEREYRQSGTERK